MRLSSPLPPAWASGSTTPRYNRPIPNTRQHAFKPKAIRIPALLSLFFLFTICLVWLEVLLQRTVKPSKYYQSHGIQDGLKKRQARPTDQCPAPEVNAQRLASLQSQHSELCTSYTTVFKPETTDLSPSMQTSFDQWLVIYSSMEALSELAESCQSSQFTSSALASIISSLTAQSTATPASTTSSPTANQLSSSASTRSGTTTVSATRTTLTSASTSTITISTSLITGSLSSSGTTSPSSSDVRSASESSQTSQLISSQATTTIRTSATSSTVSVSTSTTSGSASTSAITTISATTGNITTTSPTTSTSSITSISNTTSIITTILTTSNTTTSDTTTTTTPPADNSTICTDQGQSCGTDCGASICTCQDQSYNTTKRADYLCLPDPCACQQDPSDGSHYECGEEVNICDDICTGPFTPDGQACYTCDSETCSCQDSYCAANTTQVGTECVSGESCSSCEAETCICGYAIASYTGNQLTRRKLLSRDDSQCFDQCYCYYDDELAVWNCGSYNYCDDSSTTSPSSPTTDPPSGESSTTTPDVVTTAPNSTTPYTSSPQSTTSSSTTPYTSSPESSTPTSTTPYTSAPDSPTSTTTTSDFTTITPASCTPGTVCESCDASVCSCSSFPTIGASCTVDTCYCSQPSGTWQCNTINLCASTTTTSSAEPDSSRSCEIGSSCDNCGADSCYCNDGYCDVDDSSPSTSNSSSNSNSASSPGASTTSSPPSSSSPSSSSSSPSSSSPPTSSSSSTSSNPSSIYYHKRNIASMTSSVHKTTAMQYQIRALDVSPTTSNTTGLQQVWTTDEDVDEDEVEDSPHEIGKGRNLQLPRNIWGVMDKRQGVEILTGSYVTPIRDAWNYLLWTTPLTVRRTSSSVVSTTVAATFTLDVFPGGFTSWPSLTTTPPLATKPTIPACIPATLIQPILSSLAKRDSTVSYTKSVKPYVTRESTTVVVRIRDNYLETTSNVPTITQSGVATNADPGALEDLSTRTVTVETVAPDGSTQTLSVVVIQPSAALAKGSVASIQQLGLPQSTSIVLSGSDSDNDDGSDDGEDNDDNDGLGGGGGGGGGGSSGDGQKTNPAGKSIQKLTDNQRVVDMRYTAASYFGSMYAPAVTAIVVKIIFEPMLAALKGMEPFERLHREQGASAEDSLCSQYLSSSVSWDTIRSIWTGSSIPLWTTIIYLMVSIAAPLASASMTVRPMDECLNAKGVWRLCSPAWVIDLRFLRVLEVLLVICITLTLVLLYSSWKYHAGVPTNPTSIASVAVLLNYEPLRHDLQSIDPEATPEELERALEEYHFWLIPHHPSRNETRYGFVHSQISNNTSTSTSTAANLPPFLAKFEKRYNRLRPHLHSRHTIRLADSIHLFLTLTLLALLVTYRANTRNDAFNYFFASYSFWPKFLLVALATSLDMQWKSLEREIRITEPYRRLYLGNARPENTILRSLNGTCWSNLPRAIADLTRYPHMWFEAIIGVTAILSDANIIAVSGVLLTYSQTKAAYEWSSIIAIMTTSFMFTMLLLVVFWWRRTDAVSSMPRSPETVGAVLSYLCISKMAVDFAQLGLEDLDKVERDRVILGLGRRYRFGRMMGEDGKERFCIDYDDDVQERVVNDGVGDNDGDGDGGSGDDGGLGERSTWLKSTMDRPVPVRLSS